MERLHVLLAEERLAKEAASAGLEELQKDSQQKQKQMRDGFESRLRERQKELTACKLRLQVRLQPPYCTSTSAPGSASNTRGRTFHEAFPSLCAGS